eukprot:GHVN01096738.1.p1 GENE.GHVN01096738.1~~GHVN01096738.1.p1  ORF type:complete len:723 (+),score=168.72 GHVN01096738.1:119-2287(+)
MNLLHSVTDAVGDAVESLGISDTLSKDVDVKISCDVVTALTLDKSPFRVDGPLSQGPMATDVNVAIGYADEEDSWVPGLDSVGSITDTTSPLKTSVLGDAVSMVDLPDLVKAVFSVSMESVKAKILDKVNETVRPKVKEAPSMMKQGIKSALDKKLRPHLLTTLEAKALGLDSTEPSTKNKRAPVAKENLTDDLTQLGKDYSQWRDLIADAISDSAEIDCQSASEVSVSKGVDKSLDAKLGGVMIVAVYLISMPVFWIWLLYSTIMNIRLAMFVCAVGVGMWHIRNKNQLKGNNDKSDGSRLRSPHWSEAVFNMVMGLQMMVITLVFAILSFVFKFFILDNSFKVNNLVETTTSLPAKRVEEMRDAKVCDGVRLFMHDKVVEQSSSVGCVCVKVPVQSIDQLVLSLLPRGVQRRMESRQAANKAKKDDTDAKDEVKEVLEPSVVFKMKRVFEFWCRHLWASTVNMILTTLSRHNVRLLMTMSKPIPLKLNYEDTVFEAKSKDRLPIAIVIDFTNIDKNGKVSDKKENTASEASDTRGCLSISVILPQSGLNAVVLSTVSSALDNGLNSKQMSKVIEKRLREKSLVVKRFNLIRAHTKVALSWASPVGVVTPSGIGRTNPLTTSQPGVALELIARLTVDTTALAMQGVKKTWGVGESTTCGIAGIAIGHANASTVSNAADSTVDKTSDAVNTAMGVGVKLVGEGLSKASDIAPGVSNVIGKFF